VIRGFFPGEGFDYQSLQKKEPNLWMLVPVIVLALLAAFTVWPRPFTELAGLIAADLM